MDKIKATAPLADSAERALEFTIGKSEHYPDGIASIPEFLVAFSGGADSAALLHFLIHTAPKSKIYAVHVNHQIRGNEADRDEEFCRKQCEQYGVQLLVRHYDVPVIAKKQGISIELAARNARKEAFYAVSQELATPGFGQPWFVTAHTADDSLETMIFNLARGTGLKGMRGIVPTPSRPLIYVSRQEILDYCSAHGVEYIHDSTNDCTDYTRNYIRHNIVPHFRHLNPQVHTAVSRLSENLCHDEHYINGQSVIPFLEFFRTNKFTIDTLKNNPNILIARALDKAHSHALSRLYRDEENPPYGQLTSVNIKKLIELIRQGEPTQLSLPGKVRAKIENGYLTFIRDERVKKQRNHPTE